jgi:hypothetical protein
VVHTLQHLRGQEWDEDGVEAMDLLGNINQAMMEQEFIPFRASQTHNPIKIQFGFPYIPQ